ncbi:MAG: tryptophan-rich sensory protein [Patescibacteria group bacterium]|nr:tryptophan-rich sensory protein [Patescibacteria group bacterium]
MVCQLTGLISTPFTVSSVRLWYSFLNKPFFSPPNWIFGPVWTTLYLLMGISAGIIWNRKGKAAKKALGFFALQLFLNFLWSIFFFGFHLPFLALLDLILLWLAILVTMKLFYKISELSFWLLVPYILWVSFAGVLNLAIVLLNP